VDSVVQWSIYERVFSSSREYDVPYPAGDEPLLIARVTHRESGATYDAEGFWDGGSRWVLRFAPTRPGTWEYVTRSPDEGLDGQSGSFTCQEASPEELAANPNLRGHVRVDPTGRRFEYADGTPFFLLGDTNWAMNTLRCGLGKDEDGPFFVWLRDRRAKGFTAVATQTFDIDQPNEGGCAFLSCSALTARPDLSRLNPEFFRYLDRRMRALWETGWVVLVQPTWIGKELGIRLDDAVWISRYLLARYGAYNLIWSLSGEYQYAYTHLIEPWTKEDWQVLGRQVARFNVYGHPVSVHPSGRQDLDDPPTWPKEAHQASSGGEFHDEPWLDHNWLQTGHSIDCLWRVPQRVAENYAREPHKPVVHAEGFYEMQTVEGASARMVRWQAWVAYLQGAAGHVYGASGLWQFYDPEAEEGGDTDRSNTRPWHGQSWLDALDYPGSRQLSHLAKLMTSLQWHRLEPHRDWLRVRGVPPQEDSLTDPYLAAIPDETVVVYIPAGNSGKRIEIPNLGRRRWTARWYDPRTGEVISVSDEPVRGDVSRGCWRTPPVYRHGDYVLLLTAVP